MNKYIQAYEKIKNAIKELSNLKDEPDFLYKDELTLLKELVDREELKKVLERRTNIDFNPKLDTCVKPIPENVEKNIDNLKKAAFYEALDANLFKTQFMQVNIRSEDDE